MTIFLHNVADKKGRVLANGMNSSIIHDNICNLIHKKYHPKSYHSDIKYHMTFSVVLVV